MLMAAITSRITKSKQKQFIILNQSRCQCRCAPCRGPWPTTCSIDHSSPIELDWETSSSRHPRTTLALTTKVQITSQVHDLTSTAPDSPGSHLDSGLTQDLYLHHLFPASQTQPLHHQPKSIQFPILWSQIDGGRANPAGSRLDVVLVVRRARCEDLFVWPLPELDAKLQGRVQAVVGTASDDFHSREAVRMEGCKHSVAIVREDCRREMVGEEACVFCGQKLH